MKVSSSGSSPIQSSETTSTTSTAKSAAAKKAKAGEKTASAEGARKADGANAEISTKSREFARAKAVADGTPDVREEKIAELKRRIAAGSYKVDPDAVADRMVDDHLNMSGVG